MSPRPFPLIEDDGGDVSSHGSTCEDDKESDAYSMTSGSGSGVNGVPSESSHGDLKDKIIKGEEKSVRVARIAVGVILLICAASVSVAVYTFARNAELAKFQEPASIGSIKQRSPKNNMMKHMSPDFAREP